MRYLSICSGIEAATTAWHGLGWTPVGFAEIEPFPSAVLAHHYPTVPNHGDMTKFHEWPDHQIELLVGGTPCQAFSVAGLREGLNDPRGNLTLTFLALATRYRPRWVVWENVPGVLSSITTQHPPEMAAPDDLYEGEERECVEDYEADSSHAISCFLDGLQKLGYGCALRCLDAQYFGLAQRRKRVFVVAYLGDWTRAAEVLFEPNCLRGNPPPSREAGQETAGTLAARTSAGGGLDTDFDLGGGLRAGYDLTRGFTPSQFANYREGCGTLRKEGDDCGGGGGSEVLVTAPIAPTLNAHFGDKQGLENQHINSGALQERDAKGPDSSTKEGHLIVTPQGGFFDDRVTHALRAEGFDASEDGTGRGTPLTVMCIKGAAIGREPQNGPQYGETLEDLSYTLNCIDRHAVAFSCKDHGADAGDVSPTLRSMGHQGSHPNGGGQVAVAFETRFARNGRGAPSEIVPPLKASSGETGKGDGAPCVAFNWNAQTDQMNFSTTTTTPSLTCSQGAAIGPLNMSVRRLTPKECCRLQGFPDNYLDITYRGKPAADGPKYKALGNSMAVPCMRWIGERIAAVQAHIDVQEMI